MTTRVVIADDEAPARRIVRSYLGAREGVEVVGEAENGLEVVDAVRTLEPDLVVLDIQMPGMTGFEAIEAIGVEAMPAVVFATAYDEYALRAFDVHAVDYLLKPFSRERFDRAFERALERRRAEIAPLVSSAPLERVVVRDRDRLFFLTFGAQPLVLAKEQVAKWEKDWNAPSERFELVGGAGKTWTAAEQAAGADGTRLLTQEDPGPQTIYRVAVKPGEPILVKVPLRYSKPPAQVRKSK